jgi:class 3 adenylate cyclase
MSVSDRMSRSPIRCLHGAFDAAAYSRKTSLRQRDLQERIMTVVQRAVEAIGFDLDALWLQPQGDGALVRFPHDIDEPATVAGLIRELRVELETANRDLVADAWVRLRLALHVGLSYHAALGLAGDAPVVVCRLVNAPRLRELLAGSDRSALAVILHDALYQDLVVHRLRGLDPEHWEPAQIVDRAKHFECRGWMTVPGEAPGPHRPAAEEAPNPITLPAQQRTPLFGHVESVEKVAVFEAPVHIERGGFTIN